MAIIPFGKYKGKEISYVYENDLKYYCWLNSIELKDTVSYIKCQDEFVGENIKLIKGKNYVK